MSFYDGLYFFVVLVLGCVPAIILGLKEKPIERYLFVFSFLMICLVYTKDIMSLIYLCVFVFMEWHVIVVFQYFRRREGKNKVLFYHAVVWALLPLLIAKIGGLVGKNWFAFIGISYITFKILQIIIETHDGLIERSVFLKTMNFLLFFPTLSSGPIDRSRRFESDLMTVRPREEYVELLQKGIRRILTGALYKFVLSAIAFTWLEKITGRFDLQYVVLYAYVYGIYMFFDFAGYSLMAIGTGNIFGIDVPDNFKKPFISVDIKEFWDRWHISLSHWFRDFVFSRFVRNAIRSKRFKNRINAATAGYIVNMLIMGIWHGVSLDYVIYGLYHGILLALMERFQKTKWYKEHRNKKWYKIGSWFATLNLVMFGFLIFSGYFMETIRALGYKMM